MKKTRQRRTATPVRPIAQNRNAPGRTAGNGRLAHHQHRADHSPATQQLHTVQRRANGMLQREVDTSRSPSVGRGVANYQYPLPASDEIPKWAAENYGNAGYGTDGKLKNDPSDGVRNWAKEEYKNKVGKTGTVDTSSGPRMPVYGPDEKPAWEKNDPTGVPEWAKQEYEDEAPRTFIASVADGKIGSIYFPDGRIRTTHKSGPTESKHRETLQYNIDYGAASAEFEKKHPKLYDRLFREQLKLAEEDPSMTERQIRRAASKAYNKKKSSYIANKLNVPNPSKMPAFVRLVTRGRKLPSWAGEAIKSPDDAPDMDTDTTAKFFEVFRDINGRVEGWHPSRGAAKKWVTNKQVISVLKAAMKHLKDHKIKGAKKRNIAFYDFIAHRIPDFAAQIRKPDEI